MATFCAKSGAQRTAIAGAQGEVVRPVVDDAVNEERPRYAVRNWTPAPMVSSGCGPLPVTGGTDERVLRPRRGQKGLDFRFADEDDAEELGALLDKAYEEELASFRTEKRYPAHKLAETLRNGSATRWLVLELPNAAEDMVAACEFAIIGLAEQKSCEIFGFATAVRGKGLGSYLLRKLEAVAGSHGVQKFTWRIPHIRDDLYAWLKHRGFEEQSGGPWAEVDARPTLVPMSYIRLERRTQEQLPQPRRGKQVSVINPAGDDMLNLMGTLVAHLRTEAHEAQMAETAATVTE